MNLRKALIAIACCAVAATTIAQTPSKQAVTPAYQAMDITDLKVDIKQLMGKKISVKASIQQMGEMAMLKSDPVDMTPVWANTDALPRDDRKKLASGCQMILCGGQFYGTVKQGPIGATLVVDRVEWR